MDYNGFPVQQGIIAVILGALILGFTPKHSGLDNLAKLLACL